MLGQQKPDPEMYHNGLRICHFEHFGEIGPGAETEFSTSAASVQEVSEFRKSADWTVMDSSTMVDAGGPPVVANQGVDATGNQCRMLLLSYTPWGWQPIGYELGILRLNDQPAHQWPQLESLLKGALGRARVHP